MNSHVVGTGGGADADQRRRILLLPNGGCSHR